MKLKSGRADLAGPSTFSADRPNDLVEDSIADIGRRPDAREKEAGAEAGEAGRAGNTK